MQTLPFKQVDVFTQKPFLGNPVAVAIGAEGLVTEEMQRIAAWTNLSETTFVLPPSSERADYHLRIFTPKQELPFAGHPTVGSAHAVMESGFAAPRSGKLHQECLAGLIELTIEETEIGKLILVQAPKPKVSMLTENTNRLLTAGLGAACDSSNPPLRVDVGVVWLVANMGDAGVVATLKPDLDTLLEVSTETQAVGVTVFGRSNDGHSALHVRSFAPALGVPEDPVCGSGNGCVGAYLAHTSGARAPLEYRAEQGIEMGRPGRAWVRVEPDGEGWRVQVGGTAVTVVEGELRIPV